MISKRFLNYLTAVCFIACFVNFFVIADERDKGQNFAHVKILKGSVRNQKGEQFFAGKSFELSPEEIITLSPITFIEISGIDPFSESIIIRNHASNKTKKFSISEYLNKKLKSMKANAYKRLKNALLPRSYYYVCRFDGQIEIDGKLDDEAWKTSVPMPLFSDLVTDKTPRFAATCKALWDDKYLYLGYRVEDPCIWALSNIRDEQMWQGNGENNDNFVKFFADPDCDGCDYVEIHVNPLNNIFDALIPFGDARFRKETGSDDVREILGTEWDCEGIKTAVNIQGTINKFDDVDESWTLEMRIPFKSLKGFDRDLINVPPKNNTKWLVHLCRRYRLSKNAPKKDTWYFSWPASEALSTHRVSKYGYFIFKDVAWKKLLKEIYKEMKECGND